MGGNKEEDFVREMVRFLPFKVRKVLTENGKEFLSEVFGVYLKSEGVEQSRTRVYSSWKNGIVERWIGIFWLDYLVNRRERVLEGKTLFEVMVEKWENVQEVFWIDPKEHFKSLFDNISGLDN